MIFDYVLVGVLAFFAGGWAIPAGVLFGLSRIGVWAAASLGSSIGIAFMVYVGGRARDAMERRLNRSDQTEVNRRARAMAERWGVGGLALVGTVVLGPTITTMAALALGVDRRRFTVWAIIATLGVSTVLTLGWDAVL